MALFSCYIPSYSPRRARVNTTLIMGCHRRSLITGITGVSHRVEFHVQKNCRNQNAMITNVYVYIYIYIHVYSSPPKKSAFTLSFLVFLIVSFYMIHMTCRIHQNLLAELSASVFQLPDLTGSTLKGGLWESTLPIPSLRPKTQNIHIDFRCKRCPTPSQKPRPSNPLQS